MLPDYEGLVDVTNKDEDKLSPVVRLCGIVIVIISYILAAIIIACCVTVISLSLLILLFPMWLVGKIELIEKSIDWKIVIVR